MMLDLNALTTNWETNSLTDLDPLTLTRRMDTKFLLHENQLEYFMRQIENAYSILQIQSNRVFQYKTVYFDTPNFLFYLDHHNGFINRMKVRYREYVDSGLSYFEIKKKLPAQQTEKKRFLIHQYDNHLTAEQYDKVEYRRLENQPLEKKLVNYFKRITIAGLNHDERITIDTNISFDYGNKSVKLPHVAIIEVKQAKFDVTSPVVKVLKSMKIFPTSISKYTIGVAHSDFGQKSNGFKPQILQIQKIQSLHL